jgi:hypothetical protein
MVVVTISILVIHPQREEIALTDKKLDSLLPREQDFSEEERKTRKKKSDPDNLPSKCEKLNNSLSSS